MFFEAEPGSAGENASLRTARGLKLRLSTGMSGTVLSSFGDPTTFAAALNDIGDVALVAPGGGPFCAGMTRIVLPRMSLLAAEERQARVAFVTPSDGRAAIMLPCSLGEKPLWNGAPVGDGEMVTICAGARPHWYTRGATRWMAVCLTTDALAARGRILAGPHFCIPPELHRWRPPTRALRTLVDLCRAVVLLTEAHPAMPVDAEAARGVEQELLQMLVECLSAGRPEPEPPARRREAASLARLEDLLHAPAGRRATATALFAALGASEPALRACCRAHLGVGPRLYVRLRRARIEGHNGAT